jgi:uncharacterized membrane protein
MNPKQKTALLASTLLLATFVAGGVSGALLWRQLTPQACPEPPPGPRHPAPHRALGLTADQHKQARVIGEKYRKDLDAIRFGVLPQVEAIHKKMRAELRQILTPAQRRIQDSRKDPPHPPPGHPPPGHPPPEHPPATPPQGHRDLPGYK